MSQQFTIYEVAAMLGVHPNTARKYARKSSVKGQLVRREIGGSVRLYSEEEIAQIKQSLDSRVNRSESTALSIPQVQEIIKQALDSLNIESSEKHRQLISAIERTQESIGRLTEDLETLREEHQQQAISHAEELQQREQRYTEKVVALDQERAQERQETQRREETLLELMQANHEAAQAREAELLARLDRLEEKMSRPWWAWWRRNR